MNMLSLSLSQAQWRLRFRALFFVGAMCLRQCAMRSCGSKGPPWLSLLVALLYFGLPACTPTTRTLPRQTTPLVLQDPLTIYTTTLSLTVGTNRWSTQATVVEDAFLPLAVTVHNTAERPLCGGVPTATLQTPEGTSFSAVSPTSVVTRLFGPVAAVEPGVSPPTRSAQESEGSPVLLLVQGSHGGHAYGGGMHGGSGYRFAPQPFTSPFSAPFASPFSPYAQSPFSSPFGYPPFPYTQSPFSPFTSPFSPYAQSPFSSPFTSPSSPYTQSPFSSPFTSPSFPFSRSAPYDYGSGLPSLPPPLPPSESDPSPIDQSLVKEIFAAAFASQPLAPRETRTGFLFFPRPSANEVPLTLTWSWYDCVTHELLAQLSVPVTRQHL